jgi:hypothetical protein
MTFEQNILGNPITPENKRKKSAVQENEDDDYFHEEDNEENVQPPLPFEDRMIQLMENIKPDRDLDDRKLTLEEKRFEFEKQKWEQQTADSRAEADMLNKLMMVMIDKLGK